MQIECDKCDSKPENPQQKQVNRTDKGTFAPGQSGNPKGKPPGIRNKQTLLAEKLMDENVEAVSNKAIQLALEGDVTAIKIVLDKLIPTSRERTLKIDLPRVQSSQDLIMLQAGIIERVAQGELSPSEGQKLTDMTLKLRESFELENMEQRLKTLEAYVQKENA